VSFAAITPCVASQRVFIVVSVYFVFDSVRKLLDTPSYFCFSSDLKNDVKTKVCEDNEQPVVTCFTFIFKSSRKE